MLSSIRNFLFSLQFHFLGWLILATVLIGTPVWADLNSDATPRLKKKPEGIVQPTALPIESTTEVNRGGEVTLTLRGVARGGGELEFKILQKPLHGKILRTNRIGLDTLTMLYRHSGTRSSDVDQLRFSVRARGLGPFSPGEIKIVVRDLPGKLLVPDTIDFPATLVGETITEPFVAINDGGLPVTGLIRVSPPWRLVGGENYNLAPNGRRKMAVVFEPTSSGRFQGRILFDGKLSASIELSGEGIAPFLASPATLELQPDLTVTPISRTGIITLQNNRPEPIVIAIKSDWPLPSEVTLQFGEVQELKISDPGIGLVQGTVAFSLGKYTTRVQVMARESTLPVAVATPMPTPPLPSPAVTLPALPPTPIPTRPVVEVAETPPEDEPQTVPTPLPPKNFLPATLTIEKPSRVRIDWPLPNGASVERYRIEQRRARPDPRKKIVVEWIPVKTAVLRAEAGEGRAVISDLEAYNRFVFRVVDGAGGDEKLTSRPLEYSTPPGWRQKWRWRWLLFPLAGVLVWVVVRKRWRESTGGW